MSVASDKLRKNALSTVRHTEFCLNSCHAGSNESIDNEKNLVPLLTTYMPYLQTLRLWRDDDFPWTSIQEALDKAIQNEIVEFTSTPIIGSKRKYISPSSSSDNPITTVKDSRIEHDSKIDDYIKPNK
ncbi:unnamed protein product [Rotaria sp. Silwood1]|nr:unnamed protein product [Rotaria sp. Silwood1]